MEKTNLFIGKSGSGKTSTLFPIVQSLISNNENMLILDSKEEYYKTYSKKLKENGYNVLVLNLKEALKSNGYNPLALTYYYYKNDKQEIVGELLNNLGHSIFKEESINSDPFWENAAADYFTSLTLTLFKEGSKDEINIGSILTMLSKDNDNFKNYLEQLDPLNPIYMSGSSTAFAPYETKTSILSVMRQKLNTYLINPELLKILCNDEFNLSDLKEKTAIFIIGKNNLNNLANTLITEVFTLIKYTNYKINFILDNFDTLPKLNILKEMIDNSSYYNITVYTAIKDLIEMESIYGKFIFNHFDNIINVTNNQKLNIGNYEEYPKLKDNKAKYFDIDKLK